MSAPSPTDPDQVRQRCIENCLVTKSLCEQVLTTIATNADTNQRTVFEECAQLCGMSIDFMRRDSDLHPFICFACTEACRRCAQECERRLEGGELLLRCGEACRHSEMSCRAMSFKVRELASEPLESTYSPPRPEEQ